MSDGLTLTGARDQFQQHSQRALDRLEYALTWQQQLLAELQDLEEAMREGGDQDWADALRGIVAPYREQQP